MNNRYFIFISIIILLHLSVRSTAKSTLFQPRIIIDSGSIPDDSACFSKSFGWPPDWEVPSNTGSFAYCEIEAIANPRINDIPLENGDYIGVFYTDGQGEMHCAGAGEWNSSGLLFGFFGDDPYTPVKDGFTYNEVIKFKIFDWSNNKAYDVPITNVQYGSCAGCNLSGKFNGLGIHKVINMYLNFVLDVFVTADPNPQCIAGTSQLLSTVIGATGTVNYSWTSLPAGFTSSLPNPEVTLTQTTTYTLTVTNNSNTSSHYIKINTYGTPTVEAGINGIICSTESFTTSGDGGTDYGSLLWTTSGDGAFSDPAILHTIYTPGQNDSLNQVIELFLTAFANYPCTGSVVDSVKINIVPTASVNAGDDFIVCTDSPVHLMPTANGYSSVLWTQDGSGTAGTFDNDTILNAIYTPSNHDLVMGFINLVLTVQPLLPCTAPANDQIMVTFIRSPGSNAGNGDTICTSNNFNVNGTANNYSSVLWTSSGDGYFVDPTVLNTTYLTGSLDMQGGVIVLTITAIPNSPCTNPDSSSLNLMIITTPSVNAGDDKTFSGNDPISLNGTASNYSSVQWISNGSGSFTNAEQLSTSYILSQQDLSTDTIVIKLRANSMSPCTLPVYDSLLLINNDIITTTQTVTIPAGWSGISFNLHLSNQSIADIFAPIVDDLVLAQNFNGMYWPSQGINTLVNWLENSGCQIKMTQQVELNLPGTFLISRNVNFNAGWSFLPVLSECPISITAVLGSFPQVNVVREIAGNGIYWPDQNINTIGILNPGKSYMIKTSSNISITFPECENE